MYRRRNPPSLVIDSFNLSSTQTVHVQKHSLDFHGRASVRRPAGLDRLPHARGPSVSSAICHYQVADRMKVVGWGRVRRLEVLTQRE